MQDRTFELFFDLPRYADEFVMQAPYPRGGCKCYDIYNDEGETRLVFDIPDEHSAFTAFVNYCRKAEGLFDFDEV